MKTNNRWAIVDRVFKVNYQTAVIVEASFVISNLIDGLVVSKFLPENSMAAFGLAMPVFTIVAVFSGLLSIGTQILCSQEIGKGNVIEFNRIFSSSFYISAIFSLILSIAVILAADPIAVMLGASREGAALKEGAAEYIRGIAAGFPAIILVSIISPVIQIDSGRKRIAVSSNADLVTNAVFDLMVAFFGWGLFEMGLATTIGRYVRLIILLMHLRDKSHLLRFVPLKTSFSEFFYLLSLGTEKAWRRLGNIIRLVFINRMFLFYGGVAAMTAMSVRGSIAEVTEIVSVGLADTVGLLASIYYSERSSELLLAMGKSAHRLWAKHTGMIAAGLILLSYPLARFYTGDSGSLLMLTAVALIALALQTPLQALVRPRISYLQRIHKTQLMWAVTMLSGVVYPILAAFVLGALFGVYGVIFAYTVGDLLSLITIYIYLAVKNRQLIPPPVKHLNLPDDFEPGPGDVISLDIRNLADVHITTEQIALFCKGHKLTDSISNRASVCFEEVAARTVQEGFPLSYAPNPIIDLKVIIADDKLTIRLQDNCPKYDIVKRLELLAESNGIDLQTDLSEYLVLKLADDVRYTYSFETNIIFMDFNLMAS